MGGWGSGRPKGIVSEDKYAMSFAEIGAALGCSEAAAREMCRRAMQKIRSNPARVERFAELIEAARQTRKPLLPGLRSRMRQGGIRTPA